MARAASFILAAPDPQNARPAHLAVDLPGHGKSEGLGHHTIDDYTGEIMEFIKALKLNAVVLAGHSMGSAIALKAAIRFPKQVLGLCLLGSGARLRVAQSILQSASDPSTFASAVRQVMDGSFSPEMNGRLKELSTQRLEETRPSVLYGDLLACNAFNVTDQLSQISAPTFILCGALDKMVPLKVSESLRDHITRRTNGHHAQCRAYVSAGTAQSNRR